MVLANPPLAEPVTDPGGVINKPPFEMGVANLDNQSIQHTRWNCTYHIVFIPKYRKKVMYGSNKKDLVEIIKKLCEMKGIQLIEGKVCVDHIHMYVAIPPKMSVSESCHI